ncbi:cytochrome P450 [Dichotomicrobium thermohalophilum]|nr:cytochrome P450 [Dichotomicrobium thermohalophilum]
MRRNALSVLPNAAYQEEIVSGTMGPRRWHLVQGPEAMKRIFLDNVENYPKSSVMVRMLRPAAGNSLMTASGDDWRWQRRAIGPVFASRNMGHLAPMMVEAAEIAAARIAARLPTDRAKGVWPTSMTRPVT